ncbi:hypothetical protein [Marilutibacter aestuarii]|uniref:Uncharacterized protein n=1 Tax=Marilutibacter aestuarii TaxID=1706195 RepID=A0A508AP23_9GAMM|nr:hypothetical protein [Lysobacter aestuarii]TQD51207.1 hypothetical protein FKV25_01890 [Lysobacter aestuarii]
MSAPQLDLFALPPPAPPAEVRTAAQGVTYSVVPKGDRFGISWRAGDAHGVVGGLYASVQEAETCIAYRLELRAAGIQDPRAWMRIPPEGPIP